MVYMSRSRVRSARTPGPSARTRPTDTVQCDLTAAGAVSRIMGAADAGTLQRLKRQLQRSAGNAAVQRLVAATDNRPGYGPSVAEPPTQRSHAEAVHDFLLQRQEDPRSGRDDLLDTMQLRALLEMATSDADYRWGATVFTRDWIRANQDKLEEILVSKLIPSANFDFRSTLDDEDEFAMRAIRRLNQMRHLLVRMIARHIVQHRVQWQRLLSQLPPDGPGRLFVHLTMQLRKFVFRDLGGGLAQPPQETAPLWEVAGNGHPAIISVDSARRRRQPEYIRVETGFLRTTSTVVFTFPVEVTVGPRVVPTPPPVPVPRPTPRRVTVAAELLFEFDSATILPGAEQALRDSLRDRPQRVDSSKAVEVRGHTDAVGSTAYNQALSERRANAVKQLLERIYPNFRDRVQATGLGEIQPVAPNRVGGRDNPEGRKKNRRVEIQFSVLEG